MTRRLLTQRGGWKSEKNHWSPHERSSPARHESFARAAFTHDLDFGTLLALTHADGPSVLQVRGQNILPRHLEPLVVAALHQYDAALSAGALVVVEEKKSRVRVLPL